MFVGSGSVVAYRWDNEEYNQTYFISFKSELSKELLLPVV